MAASPYPLKPANSRCISGRRFSPSEEDKRQPKIHLLFAGYMHCVTVLQHS